MKRLVFAISIVSVFIFVATFTGCESSAQKENEMYEQNYKAWLRQEANRQNSNTVILAGVSNVEWEKFKTESLDRIRDNATLIYDLRLRINRSGKKSDLVFEKWVTILEQKNKFLKERIAVYPEIQSDWESFKYDINKDLDELSKELKKLDTQNVS